MCARLLFSNRPIERVREVALVRTMTTTNRYTRMIVQKFQIRFIYIHDRGLANVCKWSHSIKSVLQPAGKKIDECERDERTEKNMHRNIISCVFFFQKCLIYINDMYDLFNINFQWQTTHTLCTLIFLIEIWC